MNLQQIHYFVAVAEEKSFSKASQKLFISQPALSQIISKLENSYNAKFFDRSTNPLQITQEGIIFLKHAKEILNHENMINEELYELSQMKRGILKIGVIPFRASCLLAPSIIEFNRRHSDITVEIKEDNSVNLKNMILNGDIDLAVAKGKFSSDLFDCERLMSDRIYLAVSENNPINHKISRHRLFADDIKNNSERVELCRSVDVGIFKNEKFLILEGDETIHISERRISEMIGFMPDIALCARHFETLFSFVLSGMGIAFVPEIFIKFANISYHPAYYRIDNLKCDIYMVSKSGRSIPAIAKEYKNILMGMVSD